MERNRLDYFDEREDVFGTKNFKEVLQQEPIYVKQREILVGRVDYLEDQLQRYRRILHNLITHCVQSASAGIDNETLLANYGSYIEDLKALNK